MTLLYLREVPARHAVNISRTESLNGRKMFTVDDSNRLIYWSNWKEVANLDDQNWYSNGIQSLSYADTMKVRSMYPNVSSVTMYVLTSLETGCLSSMQNLRRARFPHITSVG
jgi:hypothetical protein